MPTPNKRLIVNAVIVNEGKQQKADVLIYDGKIEEVFNGGRAKDIHEYCEVVDARGKYLMPGIIDDQVHFREPGLTHKGDIFTESKAAIAGGVTSFMEMPNTVPNATNQKLITQKFELAKEKSLANFSFYIGATNDNLEELLATDFSRICGVKLFMGSSTGNMLVDEPVALKNIFSKIKGLIAVHCEDEAIIRKNTEHFRAKYGENAPVSCHPAIRSQDACYASSALAVELAQKYDTRLHVLHLSTAKELALFRNDVPLSQKRITNEVCVHHLRFCDSDYAQYGTRIKWNPAIKTSADRESLLNALLNGNIDVVATDHAPHTLAEKENSYFNAPSGGPLVQHSLVAMLDLFHEGKITIEQIVEKMCHNPAILFGVKKRGFIRKGYWADLILVDTKQQWEVSRENILYKCGWSPFEGHTFRSAVTHTWVNGNLIYQNGQFNEKNHRGMAMEFAS